MIFIYYCSWWNKFIIGNGNHILYLQLLSSLDLIYCCDIYNSDIRYEYYSFLNFIYVTLFIFFLIFMSTLSEFASWPIEQKDVSFSTAREIVTIYIWFLLCVPWKISNIRIFFLYLRIKIILCLFLIIIISVIQISNIF